MLNLADDYEYSISKEANGNYTIRKIPIISGGCGSILFFLFILFLNAIGVFSWLGKNSETIGSIIMIISLIVTAIGLFCLLSGILSSIALLIIMAILWIANTLFKAEIHIFETLIRVILDKLFPVFLYGFFGSIPIWIITVILGIFFDAKITI